MDFATYATLPICLGIPFSPVARLRTLLSLEVYGLFDGFILPWVHRKYLAWLPEWKLWGNFLISINPKWPARTKKKNEMMLF